MWAAWDYIGEAGFATPIAPPGAEQAAKEEETAALVGGVGYPWILDFQCDIDLIGQRKPQNYYRAVVHGLSAIEMMVERPPPPGTQQYAEAMVVV